VSTEKKNEAPATPAAPYVAADHDLPGTMFADVRPAPAVAAGDGHETKRNYWLEARWQVAKTAHGLELTLSEEQLLLCAVILFSTWQEDKGGR
jgi:hypothetical protein